MCYEYSFLDDSLTHLLPGCEELAECEVEVGGVLPALADQLPVVGSVVAAPSLHHPHPVLLAGQGGGGQGEQQQGGAQHGAAKQHTGARSVPCPVLAVTSGGCSCCVAPPAAQPRSGYTASPAPPPSPHSVTDTDRAAACLVCTLSHSPMNSQNDFVSDDRTVRIQVRHHQVSPHTALITLSPPHSSHSVTAEVM